jgi:predicted transposase/invertase (TIGR01784 family)
VKTPTRSPKRRRPRRAATRRATRPRIPRDAGYKYLFSNRRIFHQFLTRFVDAPFVRDIRLRDVHLVDRSFVGDDLQKRDSDIVYRVRVGDRDVFVYVLVEFQSTVDKTIPIRTLLYILKLYDRMYRNSRAGLLPAVLPIVLYSGHDPWTIPTDVATLIQATIPSEYIPSFRYYAVIERDIDDETLRRMKGLVAAVIYLEKRGTPEELSAAIDEALTMIAEEHGEELRMFVTWLSRMFGSVLDERAIHTIRDARRMQPMVAQLAQQIEARGEARGEEIGEARGKKIGAKTQARETAQRMIAAGLDAASISAFTQLPAEEVQRLRAETETEE